VFVTQSYSISIAFCTNTLFHTSVISITIMISVESLRHSETIIPTSPYNTYIKNEFSISEKCSRNNVYIYNIYYGTDKKSSSIKAASLLFLAQANWSQTRKNAVIRVNKIINISAYQMHNVQIITVR